MKYMSIQAETRELLSESNEIMSVMCQEPEGDILRTVKLLVFTPENLYKLWEKISQYPTLYGVDVKQDPQVLLDHLFTQEGFNVKANGLFFVVDDFVGLFTLNDIRPGESASVHYSFFDRRHKGRVDLIRMMLNWAFNEFQFKRLETTVPVYVKPYVMQFVTEDLGFRYEGKKRKATTYQDKRWDVNLYGMLREEL